MSGIRSTSGTPPTPPVDAGGGTGAGQRYVSPVNATNPTGQQGSPQTQQSQGGSVSQGALLAAVVTARASSGDTMLHTEMGNFRMSSTNPIPVGSHVVLEVESVTDMVTARVTAINGEKLASPPTVTLLPVVNKPTTASVSYGGQYQVPDKLTLDTELQRIATALESKGQQTTRSQNVKTAMSTPTIETTVIPSQGNPKSATPTPSNQTLFAASLVSSNVSASPRQTSSSGAAAYSHTLNPGGKDTAPQPPVNKTTITQVNVEATTSKEAVRLTIDSPPLRQTSALFQTTGPLERGSQISAIYNTSANVQADGDEGGANRLTGTVIGTTAPKTAQSRSSQVFVQSPELGTFRFTTFNPPAVGASVSFTVQEELTGFPLPPTMGAVSIFKTPHLPIMSQWENLREALNTLAAQNPSLTQNFFMNNIPRMGAHLGASLLFFISAVNGGNLSKWMGQDLQLILESSGKGDLLRTLNDEFATLTRLASEPGGQDWRALVFPFFDGEKLHQLRTYYRRHKREGSDGEEETRFIIELDLTKTGPLQMDGLFRSQRFDLVLRTTKALPDQIRADIGSLFTENLEITGVSGSLTFKEVGRFPIHPTEEWESNPPAVF
ncbi:hypothetical protein GUA87_17070 [Sneathiella sp. P13V-1]|uniref:hypothetical protein n=1 Tax=Sneathiella sp. P13V-1 TaxID=2697366 RepID=UPI00187B5F84|nr:hypothetical protein [Sneathiella sp. P13V-1]MBE7638571.1 hypothetical protein [Sneathiella sp. P13V-1]